MLLKWEGSKPEYQENKWHISFIIYNFFYPQSWQILHVYLTKAQQTASCRMSCNDENVAGDTEANPTWQYLPVSSCNWDVSGHGTQAASASRRNWTPNSWVRHGDTRLPLTSGWGQCLPHIHIQTRVVLSMMLKVLMSSMPAYPRDVAVVPVWPLQSANAVVPFCCLSRECKEHICQALLVMALHCPLTFSLVIHTLKDMVSQNPFVLTVLTKSC